MQKVDVGKHIVIDPEICHGQMTFRGTRLPVDTVLVYLAKGYSVEQLLLSWPQLSRPAIQEALYLASQSLQAQYASQLALASTVS